jgi:hypothetical protein
VVSTRSSLVVWIARPYAHEKQHELGEDLGTSISSITINVHLSAVLPFPRHHSFCPCPGLGGSTNTTRQIRIMTIRSRKQATTKVRIILFSFSTFQTEHPGFPIFQPKMPFGLSENTRSVHKPTTFLREIYRPRNYNELASSLCPHRFHHRQRELFRPGHRLC